MASGSDYSGESPPPGQTNLPPPSPAMSELALPAHLTTADSDLSMTAPYQAYMLDPAGDVPPAYPRTLEENLDLYNSFHDPSSGIYVNVGEQPAGEGKLDWAEDKKDAPYAGELGFDTPAQVEAARAAHVFARGYGLDSGPMTLFYPEEEYRNPDEQPVESGHFEFLFSADRRIAHGELGGRVEYGLQGNFEPDATTAWHIRNQTRATGQYDPTTEFTIVWVRDGPDPAHIIEIVRPGSPSPPPNNTVHQGHSLGDVDPNSLLLHDPTNRGENDQTGTVNAQYHTRIIKGNKYTLDRARAHADMEQEHKSWIVDKKGAWHQYGNYSNVDWEDKDSVERMNKWKEQALQRNEWPPKRPESRDNYSLPQRKWLFEKIKDANGGNPKDGIEKVTKDFNARYKNDQRNKNGIQALIERLKAEYKNNRGEMEERTGRGKRKRGRKKSEESEEDGGRKRRGKKRGESEEENDDE